MDFELITNIVSLVFLVVSLAFLAQLKSREELKYHPLVNCMLIGIILFIAYLTILTTSNVLNSYGYSAGNLGKIANWIVLPLTALFFLVPLLLENEL